MGSLIQDIRYGMRGLAKSPPTSLLILCLLAAGIGANTAIFSLVNALYFKAVPVQNASGLVRIYAKRYSYGAGFSQPEYLSLHDKTSTLAGLAAETQVAQLHLMIDREVREVEGFFVSSNYAPLLGLRLATGRFFLPDEDTVPDRDPVAVISHRLWISQFGGRNDAIGREIKVNRIAVKVIGVMPAGFDSDVAGEAGDVWLPTMMMRSMGYTCNGSFECTVFDRLIGRLAPKRSIREVEAELAAQIAWSATDAAKQKQPRQIYVTEAAGIEPGSAAGFRSQMRLLMAAAGTLLLIACANLAGLFLVRGLGRQKEVAVRLAIGASRFRIVRQLLTESFLLAILGGALGLMLSAWLRTLLAGFYTLDAEGFFHAYDLGLDWRILLFSVALVFLSGVLFGLGPALQACRHDLVTTLKEGGGPAGRRSGGLRQVLVSGQVTLSLVLLVSAGLLVRSSRTITRGTNFDPRHVALLRLRPELLHFTPQQNEAYYHQIIDRLESLPGVELVTMIQGGTGLIWKWDSGRSIALRLPEQSPSAHDSDSGILHHAVGPDFFQTLGIPILQGRAIDRDDSDFAPRVAVLNSTLANRLWPHQTAIGRVLMIDEKPTRVIGVAADIQPQSPIEGPAPYAYTSFWQSSPGNEGDLRMAIKVRGDPAAELPSLRRAIRTINPEVPLGEDMPMTEQVALDYMPVLLARSVMGFCGIFALCLSAVGLYSVLAFSIRSRTREIGIRMALGASHQDVARMVLGQGLRVAAWGLAGGILAAISVTRLLASWLFGVRSLDVLSFAAANVLLLMAALLASYLPSRRAAKIDPMIALRCE